MSPCAEPMSSSARPGRVVQVGSEAMRVGLLALALAANGLVQAVAIVSGQDQLTHPGLLPLLHPEVTAMLDAVQKDAAGVEAHIAQVAAPEWLWQFILQISTERDQALYLRDPFSQAYQRSLREGFSQEAGETWPMRSSRGLLRQKSSPCR